MTSFIHTEVTWRQDLLKHAVCGITRGGWGSLMRVDTLKAAALHSSILSLKVFSHLKMQIHQCQTARGAFLLRAINPPEEWRGRGAHSQQPRTPISPGCRKPRNVSNEWPWRTSCRCVKLKSYLWVIYLFDAVEGNMSQNNKTDKMVECCKRGKKKKVI